MDDGDLTYRDRVQGSLLGGAIGDALGAGIEFDSLDQIREQHGPAGVTGFTSAYGRLAPITDDTQMTLFTAEGLIRARVRSSEGVAHAPAVVWNAYQRWRATQGEGNGSVDDPDAGWLVRQEVLHSRRAPGMACLSGLRAGHMGTRDHPANPQSKGCGAVMRSAPFGWLPDDADTIWRLTIDCAVLTHGHPSGYYSAAALAVIVRALIEGEPLAIALQDALDRLRAEGIEAQETLEALASAILQTRNGPLTAERVEQLGAGWVGEEALAIAVYCALAAPDAESALLAAVNHSGDSDSTGAITGNVVGARGGLPALPSGWASVVEGRDLLLQVANDFADAFGGDDSAHHQRVDTATDLATRYPAS
jgi:ADP-ribosylglycohydrolase